MGFSLTLFPLAIRIFSMNQERAGILIVDDHAIVRAALMAGIEKQSDSYYVAGEADSATKAVELIQTLRPSILFLDHRLQDSDGFEVLEFLRNHQQAIKVIVFSQSLEAGILRAYWNFPVAAIVSKSSVLQDLQSAMDHLKTGERFLSENLREVISGAGAVTLTKREVEVAKLIATGRSNKEIGEFLGCSDQTIKSHKTNIMVKLGVNTSVEVATWVTKNGLI